jgi:ATP synthase proteolipid subunit
LLIDSLSRAFSLQLDSGYAGAASCMILSSWGSAWGTWRAGLGVCQMGVDNPSGVIKNIVPIVMAGVLGIYGLIVSVLLSQAISMPSEQNSYSEYNGYTHVSAEKESVRECVWRVKCREKTVTMDLAAVWRATLTFHS